MPKERAGVVGIMKELADLAPIIIGFLLTTVLGGVLGFYFQNRTWDHQNKIQRAEQERLHMMQLNEEKREKALQIFDEVSRLMDKRLYRLRLLYWSLPAEEGQASRCLLQRVDLRITGRCCLNGTTALIGIWHC
jgi:hypothetical protein